MVDPRRHSPHAHIRHEGEMADAIKGGGGGGSGVFVLGGLALMVFSSLASNDDDRLNNLPEYPAIAMCITELRDKGAVAGLGIDFGLASTRSEAEELSCPYRYDTSKVISAPSGSPACISFSTYTINSYKSNESLVVSHKVTTSPVTVIQFCGRGSVDSGRCKGRFRSQCNF